jgi:hypothetical protein
MPSGVPRYRPLDEVRRATKENLHDYEQGLRGELTIALRSMVGEVRLELFRTLPRLVSRECKRQLAKAFAQPSKPKAKKKRKRKAAP